jgi:hypothetical protein
LDLHLPELRPIFAQAGQYAFRKIYCFDVPCDATRVDDLVRERRFVFGQNPLTKQYGGHTPIVFPFGVSLNSPKKIGSRCFLPGVLWSSNRLAASGRTPLNWSGRIGSAETGMVCSAVGVRKGTMSSPNPCSRSSNGTRRFESCGGGGPSQSHERSR